MKSKTDAAAAEGYLAKIERLGNALPDPSFIFVWLILMLVIVSVVAAAFGVSAVHPLTGDTLQAQSLLTSQNVRRFLMAQSLRQATQFL